MRTASNTAAAPSPQIGVHFRTRRAKFGPRKFGAVAKVLWRKPAAAVASIEKCSPTTAKRILRGDAEVSINLMLAAVAEMLRPIE
jgi:hypothetical protein